MGTQQFCLRWNNHQSNMLNVFDQLLQNGDFVDVTLACEGVSIKAHKMVLSACSPYFQNLFRDNPCKHPIVILKDMKFLELKSIVDFMYKGEINVSQDQLSALLKTAETLKVKGLAEVSGGNIPGSRVLETVNATTEEGASSSTAAGATSVVLPTLVPLQNSPQPNDGRVSPHSKRKRHRPTRRLSNSEMVNNETTSEGNYEISTESDDGRVPLPKMEPLDLLAEPPLDILMDSDSRYHLDTTLVERSDLNHDPQDRETCDLHSRSEGLQSSSSISQPSTSGTQSANQDTPFIPWVRMPCRSGPCKTWQEETMFTAVRSVLKLGMPLINVSRKFRIPYPTLFYYTNRVRQVLKPYEREAATGSVATHGFLRPPGKRGRPTKVYLGTWRDEDLTRAILRVVYKDYIPETMESLIGGVAAGSNWNAMNQTDPETTREGESGSGCHLQNLEATMQDEQDSEIVPVESLIQEMEEEATCLATGDAYDLEDDGELANAKEPVVDIEERQTAADQEG